MSKNMMFDLDGTLTPYKRKVPPKPLTVKVFVYDEGGHIPVFYCATSKGLLEHLECNSVLVEDAEAFHVGEVLRIRVIEMSVAEYEALPDWEEV